MIDLSSQLAEQAALANLRQLVERQHDLIDLAMSTIERQGTIINALTRRVQDHDDKLELMRHVAGRVKAHGDEIKRLERLVDNAWELLTDVTRRIAKLTQDGAP